MRHLHTLEIARPRDPNAHLRAHISQLAAVGLPDYQIAFIACIGVETLRDFFGEEMDAASAEANAEALQTLFQLAKAGKHPSITMFWAKSRCGFHPRPENKKWNSGFDGPPPILKIVNNEGEPIDRLW
jgi:hypothetical protein